MTHSVLGIDLGTTYSVVATIDASGDVVVLRNAVGRDVTPSVVYFESGTRAVVGNEAAELMSTDPDHGVIRIKRHMGTDHPLEFWGVQHTPESVSALILKQLVAAATDAPDPKVVITVPAYFGLTEREATAQAAGIAGLTVLELLDEPVAAAMHYGLLLAGDRTILVYDLGGGTFDTTVIRVSGGSADVVATDGHHRLGGSDVEDRLLEHVLARLRQLVPEEDVDALVDDDAAMTALRLELETAKRDLSVRSTRDVVLRVGSGRLTVPLRREELEAICIDLFDATHAIVRRVLEAAAKKDADGVDDVIMVGGACRMPILAEQLARQVGVVPRLVDPDLAVAKGAALRAHQLAGTSALRALQSSQGPDGAPRAGKVTPVVPRAVGVLVDDSHDPEGQRKFVAHLIQANTPLPCRVRSSGYGTILANQDSVRIQVFEQAGSTASDEVEHNRRVLDGELTGLGPLPAGSVIEITLAVAVDGRLSVVAREPLSGRELALEAYVEGVVDTEEARQLAGAVRRITVRG